jgi:phenylalanyl-tRNA synthetase beta chain
MMGELHPLVQERYELPEALVLAADLDTQQLVEAVPERYTVRAVPPYPPVLEDLALVVNEDLPAERVEQVIRQAGGKAVIDLRLFDVYRGEQVGAGKKSLAYNLTYQDPERTLTDAEVAKVRQRIIQKLEEELEARIRS